MSYRPVFYIGHIENDGNFASNNSCESNLPALLRVDKPLDAMKVRSLAGQSCIKSGCELDTWNVVIDKNVVLFAEFSNPVALRCVCDLVESLHMVCIEGTLRVVPLSELKEMISDASDRE